MATLELEEDRQPERSSMLAADALLRLLLEDSRHVAARMAAAGFSEDEIRGAWNDARQAGYTESTGLGADRLTDAGRARARELMGLHSPGLRRAEERRQ